MNQLRFKAVNAPKFSESLSKLSIHKAAILTSGNKNVLLWIIDIVIVIYPQYCSAGQEFSWLALNIIESFCLDDDPHSFRQTNDISDDIHPLILWMTE